MPAPGPEGATTAPPGASSGASPGAKPRTELQAVAQIDPMLAAIWTKSRPVMQDRVALLRSAAETLRATGSLPEPQREEAISAAHKLAGVLGTFGFPQGTDAARAIEGLLERLEPLASALEKLPALIAALDQVVQQ